MKRYIIIGSIFSLLIISLIATLLAGTLQQQDEPDLNFSHKLHVTEQSIECSTCHSNANGSVSGTDDLLPKEKICLDCHEKKDNNCTLCHKSGKNPVLIERINNYLPKFTHKFHIDNGAKCETCHKGIENQESVSNERFLPKMENCYSCHEIPETIAGCYECHNADEHLKPTDHSDLWQQNHGNFHESGNRKCSTCHTDNYCTECHSGENLASQSHPPQFIMTHSISYLSRESDCQTCHGGLDYCIECHTKVNYIKPITHNISNWISLHQMEGKTNYDLCVVCHSAGDPTCLRCHSK